MQFFPLIFVGVLHVVPELYCFDLCMSVCLVFAVAYGGQNRAAELKLQKLLGTEPGSSGRVAPNPCAMPIPGTQPLREHYRLPGQSQTLRDSHHRDIKQTIFYYT